jgi:hypothetical protein
VSRTKLRGKTKTVFFGPTDQKLWVFELSRRSLGRAGMCWSQPARVDHLHKKWRVGRKKNSRKMGTAGRPGPNCWSPPTGRRPRAGRRPAVARLRLWDSSYFFEIFSFKKKEFLEVWVMGQGFWENGCTTPPFFESCPYTWKC